MQNVEIRWFGALGVTGDVTYNFLFDFNRNYASILYCFCAIASYLSKAADFNLPRLHLAHPFGVTPFEFCRDLWHQKT